MPSDADAAIRRQIVRLVNATKKFVPVSVWLFAGLIGRFPILFGPPKSNSRINVACENWTVQKTRSPI